MNSSKTILSEIQAISQPVANLPKTNPFTLSQVYFELFSVNLLRTIQQFEQKDLSTPENYFSTFPNKLLEKIKEENTTVELEEISPMLAGMQKQNPFYVPENYFATFNATQKKEQAVIRSVFSYKKASGWIYPKCFG